MFILVLGREKSGKSRYAESLSVKLSGGNPLYIATMVPVGEGGAGAARVARHREQREGLGFETVEAPYGLSGFEPGPGRTALLEDVQNLLSNHIFGGGGGPEAASADVKALASKCENLIAVSILGLEESDMYDEDTNNYIAEARKINSELLELADAAVEVREGKPFVIKGSLPYT